MWYQNICNVFVTKPACDRRTVKQTDRQTRRITTPKVRGSIAASRGKTDGRKKERHGVPIKKLLNTVTLWRKEDTLKQFLERLHLIVTAIVVS